MPEANKNKTKPKAKLYFGNADELAKTNNYVTPEYLQEVDKRRKDWNEFVEFLKKENVAGSANLDKSGAGLGYLKKWNKANPDKAFTQEDIKDVQYYSRNTKKETGERVNDGILGKVTSTFTFPDSRVNTYEMKNGQKVLVKSEDPNIGNYQYQADKINFGIAAKNKADVSKLPIYNKNSANTDISWDKNDATANNLLKEQTKKRSLSGQSLSSPNKFVKPLTATEYHPAVQEQLEGSYFDNNQKVVDYNQNLQQQKQAEIQQQADTRTALQKKLATSKSKDFTKEEALDYFNETGKILPQNKVQGKYTRNKENQIVDIQGNPYKTTKVIKTPGKFEFKNYGKNTWGIASEAIKDFSNFGQSTFDVTNPIDAVVGPIISEAINTPLRLGLAATAPITGAIASTKIKLPKKKSISVTNEEFGMPTFQDDAPNLTQKREGGLISKYDNGGKTKRPVFPGKLDNRIVSDNTSVQRPTIQKQNVRLKTPQEVKKERYSKIFNYDNIEIDPITNKPTGKGALESVYPEAVLLPGTPAIKGLGAVGNFALDMLNPLSGSRGLKGNTISFNPTMPNVAKPILNPIEKNLVDLNYAKKIYEPLGYKFPNNIDRIAKSNVLTDRTIRGIVNRDNSFVRGVSTNFEHLAEKNPEILRHLEGKGIDWQNNPKAAAEYMATHIPIQTGYGRVGLNQSIFNRGMDGLYTSNSIPTAEGYTYGDGFITKVKRPTDFSSTDRKDWIDKNQFSTINDYLELGSKEELKRLPKNQKIIYGSNKNPEKFIKKIKDDIKGVEYFTIKDNPTNIFKSEKKSLYDYKQPYADWSPPIFETKDEILNYINEQRKYYSDNPINTILRTEKSVNTNPNSYGFKKNVENYFNNKKGGREFSNKLDNYLQEETNNYDSKINSLGESLTKYSWEQQQPIRDEIDKLINLKNKNIGDRIIDYMQTNHPDFDPINQYAHYIHVGTPGQKILDVISSKQITPDIWKNTSRGHSNVYSKGLSKRELGGIITKEQPQYPTGGVIKDNRGQWAHPGEITEIGSNNITMQGVNYPVLGVSDQGDTQMMYPEQDYQFRGNKVTEYPMMQRGGTVKPIVVTNPNDPRLKAYNDSLSLYKITKDIENPKYYEFPKSTLFGSSFKGNEKELIDFIKNHNIQNGNVNLNNYPGKIKPIDYDTFTEGTNYPIYKKPVQPVVYQPAVAEQIKPLYQAPQLTMPKRLELSMNKPNVVQSSEGPTFKQGRKFMRESGINKDTQNFNRLPGFYQEGGKVGEDFAYDRWRRSLPENLQSESPSYNLRGYWESLNKPEVFEPFNYDLYGGEFDGPDGEFLYHGFSRNPETGEILKGKTHPTLNMALNDKDAEGNVYIPYMKDGKIYTDTYADGGTINNMKKRTLKKYQYSYGGLTVTDLNKYQNGGSKGAAGSATKTATTPEPSPTGATVSPSAIGAGIGFGAEMIGGLIPEKQYADDEGADLGSVKSIGESTLEYGAKGAAVTAMLGGADFGIATALGAGYGAYKGWADKEEMEEKQKKANFKNSQNRLAKRMNVSENWGNADVNTSTNMMFPDGGMVLNYDNPNANAELELQETFQMPDGTVGNVDGPSHEMGGIAVDLPEGTRIWSDKLKHNGKTFAKHTKPITNKIARLEKEIAKSPNNSEAKENSIALLNQQLDYYFDTQETNKQNTEMKRTLREGGMIKRADGSYSKRGLWDNIRANKGSGKKPTAEMLKQERKIRANEKAMGGYMYAEGGINNPGFRALPEEVQENILANMGMGGEMYSLGGRLMNTPMYAEGGKLPEGVLKSRLEAHMSPEEADEYLSEYGKGGYTVRRSSDRKGKTHVVIGPDGTKKYFGDPNLGERGKSKYGKEAFYARHKKNLAGNPYFRAYARATWEDGGMMGEEYAQGGIHIKPENKGKFTAYAKSHGKGVQEMAAHIMANKEDYSPTIVKRANFAKNAAGWKHEMGGYLPMYQDGDMVDNPGRVAIGAINPKTGQPYTMQEVASYTDTQGMLPTPFGKQYGGLDNTGKQLYGNYEQTVLPVGYNPKVNYAQNSLTPNNIPLKDRVKFTPPAMDSDFDMNQIPEELMYNTPQVPNPYANKPFNQLPIGITRPNTKLNIGEFGANANRYVSPENLTMENIGTATPGKTGQGFFNKAGQFIQNNPGLVGQLGTAALTAGSQMNRINKLARPRTLADVRLRENVANPNLVDYSAERNAIDRTALNAMADAQRGFGSSAAAQAFKNKARLNQLEGTGRSFQGQENANAQIRNQFLAARQEAAMKEAMMNNEIDKYNLENVYGYDTMTTAQKNAITAMLGNTAGQAFGKQSDYANQLQQANILANQYDSSVLNDMIKNGKLKVVDGQIVKARNGGTIKKRSFKK